MLRLNRNTQTKEYSNTIYEFIISEKNIHYNFFYNYRVDMNKK